MLGVVTKGDAFPGKRRGFSYVFFAFAKKSEQRKKLTAVSFTMDVLEAKPRLKHLSSEVLRRARFSPKHAHTPLAVPPTLQLANQPSSAELGGATR